MQKITTGEHSVVRVKEPETSPPVLAVVIPCYNEESVLTETARRLSEVLNELIKAGTIAAGSYIYFVDDGSSDATWRLVEELHETNPMVKGLKLAQNVGHQNALLAGLMSVKSHMDCVISIDADLQQDENAMGEFVTKFRAGADIVMGIRNDRQTDSTLKRLTAVGFYNLMRVMGVSITKNHADYRLMSRKAVEALSQYQETNLFLRGIFSSMGFQRDTVYFDVRERYAGTSKYTFGKMLSFALDGITAFSITPLRIITYIGFIVFLLSSIMGVYVLIAALFFRNHTVPGWASILLPIYFLGSVQIITIGVIGEYIGRIYSEVKARPRFLKDREIL